MSWRSAAGSGALCRIYVRACFPRPLPTGWFGSNHGMEVPFYLLLISLVIVIRGDGALPLDSRFGREI
jgi:hypothetical protein